MTGEVERRRTVHWVQLFALFVCMSLGAFGIAVFLFSMHQASVSLNRWHQTGLQNARRAVVADREIPVGQKITLKDVYETNEVTGLLLSDSALCSDFVVGLAPSSKIELGRQITLDCFDDAVQQAQQKRQLERLKRQSVLMVCSHPRVDPVAEERVQIVFAIRDIPEGQLIAKSDLDTRYLPAEKVPLDYADDQSTVIGKLSKFGIAAGQIIYFTDLALNKVFVATKDLKAGHVLTKTDFQLRKIAEGEVPPISAVGSDTVLSGASAITSIKRGEIIRLADLTLSR